jgi:hypothetical protein
MEQDLSQVFERFAEEEFHNSSPLYEELSLAIAKDPEILSLAAHSRTGERVPNLFFAAVHFLVLKDAQHPLSLWYRTLSGSRVPDDDLYSCFRSFCFEHHEEVRQLISTRRVQTNEVSRSACLLPAFALVSQKSKGRPLYLVDIGASAGLNLFWDHYAYHYGESLCCGDMNSPVQIHCALRGNALPRAFKAFPKITARTGIDLNPIDVRQTEQVLWLRALIWPEHDERARLLRRAIGILQKNPPTLIRGDGAESLPAVMLDVCDDSVLCIIRIFTQLPHASRHRLSLFISEYGAKRDVFLISAKQHGCDVSELHLLSIVDGIRDEKCVAYFQNHGAWIEWLDPEL